MADVAPVAFVASVAPVAFVASVAPGDGAGESCQSDTEYPSEVVALVALLSPPLNTLKPLNLSLVFFIFLESVGKL